MISSIMPSRNSMDKLIWSVSHSGSSAYSSRRDGVRHQYVDVSSSSSVVQLPTCWVSVRIQSKSKLDQHDPHSTFREIIFGSFWSSSSSFLSSRLLDEEKISHWRWNRSTDHHKLRHPGKFLEYSSPDTINWPSLALDLPQKSSLFRKQDFGKEKKNLDITLSVERKTFVVSLNVLLWKFGPSEILPRRPDCFFFTFNVSTTQKNEGPSRHYFLDGQSNWKMWRTFVSEPCEIEFPRRDIDIVTIRLSDGVFQNGNVRRPVSTTRLVLNSRALESVPLTPVNDAGWLCCIVLDFCADSFDLRLTLRLARGAITQILKRENLQSWTFNLEHLQKTERPQNPYSFPSFSRLVNSQHTQAKSYRKRSLQGRWEEEGGHTNKDQAMMLLSRKIQ